MRPDLGILDLPERKITLKNFVDGATT